jgi:hypothetical protein
VEEQFKRCRFTQATSIKDKTDAGEERRWTTIVFHSVILVRDEQKRIESTPAECTGARHPEGRQAIQHHRDADKARKLIN